MQGIIQDDGTAGASYLAGQAPLGVLVPAARQELYVDHNREKHEQWRAKRLEVTLDDPSVPAGIRSEPGWLPCSLSKIHPW